MDFELSQDQNIFYESVRKFAAKELADDAVAVKAQQTKAKQC